MPSYAGHTFGWDWDDHIAHKDPATNRPYLGGTDLQHETGDPVRPFVRGVVTGVTAHTLTITEADGWKLQILHLERIGVKAGLVITDPQQIVATAGKQWPHYHSITPAGVRVRARFLTPSPTLGTKDDTMYLIGDSKPGNGYLVTSNGTTPVTGEEYDLLKRVIVSDQTKGKFPETFNQQQVAMIAAAIRRTVPTAAGGVGVLRFEGTAAPA